MIRFARILRTIKSYLVEIISIGGNTQNRLVSPKGLYSKPKNENAIVINLANGENQDVVMCIQKDVDLEDNDVYLTDDRNFIHFKYENGIIFIKGDSVFDDDVQINGSLTVKGAIVSETSMTAPKVEGTTNVISASLDFNDHGHAQGNDNNGDAQEDTDTAKDVT